MEYYSAILVLTLKLVLSQALQNIVDLTHPFKANETVYYKDAKSFRIENVFDDVITSAGGEKVYVNMEDYSASTHGGTHLDAPSHFAKGAWTVDQIPVHRLIAPVCVVDCTAQALEDRNYRLTPRDLEKFEKEHGRIQEGSVVVMNTGWSRRWPDKTQFLGNPSGDPDNLTFPGFSLEAAKWLLDKKIYGVGIDTPSIDFGPTSDYIVHRTLLSKNVYALENLANLDRVPPSGARIIALPMLMKGASGGPLRALAVWDTEEAIELNLYLIFILTSILILTTAILIRVCGL